MRRRLICALVGGLGCFLAAGCAPAPPISTTPSNPASRVSASRPVRVKDYESLLRVLGDRCYPGDSDPRLATVTDGLDRPLPDGEASPRLTGRLQSLLAGVRKPLIAASASAFAQLTNAGKQRTSISAVEDLALLSDIVSVVAENDGLVVIGPPARGSDRFRPDDWYVVFRAIAGTEAPGVSIDPGPNPTQMQVRYFGNIQKTDLGTTFFEADRTLKILSTGFDNLTCSPWPDRPSNIPTEIDLIDDEIASGETASSAEGRWHRFWFEPSDNELQVEGSSLLIPEDRLVVKDESIPAGMPGRRSAREFAAAITTGFHALGERVPAFRDLQRDAALVMLAKWVRDKELVLDEQWFGNSPAAATTADATPSITVLRAKTTDRLYLRFGIHGGVDFQKPNRYRPASAQLPKLTAAAMQSAPRQASSWLFDLDGRQYRALRLPITKPTRLRGRTVLWSRLTLRTLSQPGVFRVILPFSSFLVSNETGDVVTVQLTGPSNTTQKVPVSAVDAPIRIVTGTYRLQVTSRCGVSNDTVVVREDERHKLRYWCEPVPPTPREGSLVVRNTSADSMSLALGGRTYTLRPGTTTIPLAPGPYTATVTSRCGSKTDRLEIQDGATHEITYTCTTVPVPPPTPAGGSFVVRNATGASLTVNVGGRSYTVAPGTTTIPLSPGSYTALISTRCGSGTETLNIQNGSTFTGDYSCVQR